MCQCIQVCSVDQLRVTIGVVNKNLSSWKLYFQKLNIVHDDKDIRILFLSQIPVAHCIGESESNLNIRTFHQHHIAVQPLCSHNKCLTWLPSVQSFEAKMLSFAFIDWMLPHYVRWNLIEDTYIVKDNSFVEVIRWNRASEGINGYGIWYSLTKGSGMYIRVNKVISGTRHDICPQLGNKTLNNKYKNLASEGFNCFPAAAHFLRYETIHFKNTHGGDELVAIDKASLFTGSNGACGRRTIYNRNGQICSCDPSKHVLNCEII